MNVVVVGKPTAHGASVKLQDELARAPRRLVVLDDQGKVRAGLAALRTSGERFEVITHDLRRRDILTAAKSIEPDLVIMDLHPRDTYEGAQIVKQLKHSYMTLPVLIFTVHAEDDFVDAALVAGADGYVLKSDSTTELVTAIRSLLQGKSFLSPAISKRIILGYVAARGRSGEAPADSLTSRERQVLKLVAAGYRNRDIADRLSLSQKTIEKHRSNLMRKLGLRSPAAVAAYAIAHGYLQSNSGRM